MIRRWPFLSLAVGLLLTGVIFAENSAQIDELQDQLTDLRNDVKVLEYKINKSTLPLHLKGYIDTFHSTSFLSYGMMTLAVYDSSTGTLQPAFIVKGDADYEVPLMGNIAASLSMGPRQQFNSLGQVVDFEGNHLHLSSPASPLWFNVEQVSTNTSVLGLGTGLQLAALDNAIDMGWQKRYAKDRSSDIFSVLFKAGRTQLLGRVSIGGDHGATHLEWSQPAMNDAQLTVKFIALAKEGVSSQWGDSYAEAGAMDVLGFPIENDSNYFAVIIDKWMPSWCWAMDIKTINGMQTVKAKLSYERPVNDQLTVIHEVWDSIYATGPELRALIGMRYNL